MKSVELLEDICPVFSPLCLRQRREFRIAPHPHVVAQLREHASRRVPTLSLPLWTAPVALCKAHPLATARHPRTECHHFGGWWHLGVCAGDGCIYSRMSTGTTVSTIALARAAGPW